MCSKDKATTKDVEGKAGPLANTPFRRPLYGYTVSYKYHAKPRTQHCENHKHYRCSNRWVLIVRANSTSPAEGEQLTLAKLG